MNITDLEILQGTVAAIVYQNYDNGYAVLKLRISAQQTVTVVGTIPLPTVGEQLMVTGKWSTHSSYGRQFEAEFLERLMPQSANQILTYLSSRAIKGIGPKMAARIVEAFGDETLMIMEREPERLSKVPGISDSKAKAIGEAFQQQVGMRHLMEFFTSNQLPAELAVKTYKLYGESAIELLYDDPYLLMEDGLDAPFGAVDKFAIELGVSGEDPRRVDAGVLFELRYNLTGGHSFLPAEKLTAATCSLLSVCPQAVLDSLERLHQGEQICKDVLLDIPVIYLPDSYQAEIYCADRLLSLGEVIHSKPAFLQKKLETAAASIGFSYSEQQTQAIEEAATRGLLLITGGPGTGKTTVLNGILSLYNQMGLKCLLAAPTGRAAKRLTEVTGQEASTIHRLLEAGVDPHSGQLVFAKDQDDPLKTDAVIIDEMSMVDVQLMHHFLEAVPPKARLILVGDPDQLPPVGPGFPFHDMLRSAALPTVRLTEIFRQAQKSLIVMNAHRVNSGQMPELRNVKNDFFFLPCRSEEQAAQTIAGLCSRRLPEKMGIPSQQIQVLSPTKKGAAGTVALNKLLQSCLNPASGSKQERPHGEYMFRQGDRVMQIRNNYDITWKSLDGSSIGAGVFNGDIGTIQQIDPTAENLTVLFEDRIVEYDFTQLGELEPAYAMTVHKSQGSEYRAVVLSVWGGSPYLLNRSILYTAITRARELLILVGREDTVGVMVQNAKTGKRYTGLKLRLQKKDGRA